MAHRGHAGGHIVKTSHALLLMLSAGFAPGLAGAQDAQADNHGYFGAGLMLTSNSSTTAAGDFSSTGGGIVLNGAGVMNAGTVGFGLVGGLEFGGRTDSDSDESIADAQMQFDGGIVLADLFYVSVGVQFLNMTPESSDVTATYTVVPIGLGVLSADDDGYMLAQIRFGGGEFSNDANSATADLGYFGIRLVGQKGTPDGLQFMGGLEFESYDFTDVDLTDNFFRLFVGVGFGT
jgi:hypothetical protein